MYCSIATNGSLLTRDRIESLVREAPDQLIVSMNAGRPETYGKIHTTEKEPRFHQIKESLLLLNELKSKRNTHGPTLTLSFVLLKPNKEEVRDMVALAKEVGATQMIFKHAILYDGISFLGLSDAEKTTLDGELIDLEKRSGEMGMEIKLDPPIGNFVKKVDQSPSPMEIYGKIPCYVGWLFAMIMADGAVLPCCHCFSLMGNANNQPFKQIWESDAYTEFRKSTLCLPKTKAAVPDCRCDICAYVKFNVSIHNYLHPFHKAVFSEGQREYKISKMLSSLVLKRTISGTKQLDARPGTKKDNPS